MQITEHELLIYIYISLEWKGIELYLQTPGGISDYILSCIFTPVMYITKSRR